MNHLETSLFFILSATAILASLAVVTAKRPMYSVLSLALGIVALSGLFTLLKAYFVAIIQILIYAGAILVLFLFVIMLLGVDEASEEAAKTSLKAKRAIQFILPSAFLAECLIVFLALRQQMPSPKGILGTVEAVGEALFTQYLLPFELVSAVLLIGIFGVVVLAQKESRKEL